MPERTGSLHHPDIGHSASAPQSGTCAGHSLFATQSRSSTQAPASTQVSGSAHGLASSQARGALETQATNAYTVVTVIVDHTIWLDTRIALADQPFRHPWSSAQLSGKTHRPLFTSQTRTPSHASSSSHGAHDRPPAHRPHASTSCHDPAEIQRPTSRSETGTLASSPVSWQASSIQTRPSLQSGSAIGLPSGSARSDRRFVRRDTHRIIARHTTATQIAEATIETIVVTCAEFRLDIRRYRHRRFDYPTTGDSAAIQQCRRHRSDHHRSLPTPDNLRRVRSDHHLDIRGHWHSPGHPGTAHGTDPHRRPGRPGHQGHPRFDRLDAWPLTCEQVGSHPIRHPRRRLRNVHRRYRSGPDRNLRPPGRGPLFTTICATNPWPRTIDILHAGLTAGTCIADALSETIDVRITLAHCVHRFRHSELVTVAASDGTSIGTDAVIVTDLAGPAIG